ncbi:MAG: nucleotidyltransferase domain-containing protein [Candidatus Gracilibacteria bacterium]
MDKFGLTSDQISQIQQVFSRFPKVKKVWIFGSRARGDFKRSSDIDLAYEADDFSLDEELGLRSALSALPLPYKIDLVGIHTIKEEAFLKKVMEERIDF